jgi:hypothetical protein
MPNNGAQTKIHGNLIQPQQRQSPDRIHQQNKQHQDQYQYQYQPLQQQINPTLATIHTFLRTSSQK